MMVTIYRYHLSYVIFSSTRTQAQSSEAEAAFLSHFNALEGFNIDGLGLYSSGNLHILSIIVMATY